ncbi:N/A [soil metagenome]
MTITTTALSLLRRDISGAVPRYAGSSIAELAANARRPLRVAVVRLDGIGDWILTLPLVEALRGSRHIRTVTIVGLVAHSGILGARPDVDFVPFEHGSIVDPPAPGGLLGKILATTMPGQSAALAAGRAHNGAFDLVVLPRWDSDLGFNARAFGAATGAALAGHDPTAIPGVTAREARERRLLDIAARDTRPAAHEVEHGRMLASALGLDTEVSPGYGRRFFGLPEGAPRARIIAVHPCANEPKRQWPEEMWRELITRLARGYDGEIVLVGSLADRPVHDRILVGLPGSARSAAGEVSLKALPEFLGSAEAFIGNDSGPAHIASSVGTPVVVVSPHPRDGDIAHRNSPTRFGPWGTGSKVLQPEHALAPCSDSCVSHHPHCIIQVKPNAVLDAVDDVAPGLVAR